MTKVVVHNDPPKGPRAINCETYLSMNFFNYLCLFVELHESMALGSWQMWRKALKHGYGCQELLEVQNNGEWQLDLFQRSLGMIVTKQAYLEWLAARNLCRDEWRSREAGPLAKW